MTWRSFADDNDDKEDEKLYAFHPSAELVVEEIISVVRSLLQRPDVTPRQISQLGVFLFCLARLPRQTDGVSMSLSLQYSYNRDTACQSIHMDDDSFRLESGGVVYTAGVGPDSYMSIALEAFCGGCGDDSHWHEIAGWIEEFRASALDTDYTVTIDSYAEEPFNWARFDDEDAEDSDSCWAKLADDDE